MLRPDHDETVVLPSKFNIWLDGFNHIKIIPIRLDHWEGIGSVYPQWWRCRFSRNLSALHQSRLSPIVVVVMMVWLLLKPLGMDDINTVFRVLQSIFITSTTMHAPLRC